MHVVSWVQDIVNALEDLPRRVLGSVCEDATACSDAMRPLRKALVELVERIVAAKVGARPIAPQSCDEPRVLTPLAV
jgi:hypothetical protein